MRASIAEVEKGMWFIHFNLFPSRLQIN